MSINILQWNLNGYINNFHELQLIIRDINPHVICLQETHFPYNTDNIIVPKGYSGYFSNLPSNNSSKQGVAILIKKCIPHRHIPCNLNIATICVEINIDFNFLILNSYISPQQRFSNSDLCSISSIATIPFFLLGDFNAWSPFWGSSKSNDRGKIIEDFVICEDLMVLNNGSPTHLSTHGTFTTVDLSFCSPILASKCTWETLENLHGSDHYPVNILLASTLKYEHIKPQKKFKTDLANWSYYQNLCVDFSDKSHVSNNINQEAAKLTKIIRSAANKSIPQTKSVYVKATLPWWNSDLQALRDAKQLSWQDFKKVRSNENLIVYKKANALFKKKTKEAKHLSLEDLTAKITPNSTPRRIWSDIKMLSGNRNTDQIKYLKNSSTITTSFIEIANIFGNHWSQYSSDNNFQTEFIDAKNGCLVDTYTPISICSVAKKIESKITLVEFENCLQGAKGKTPGFDRINYPMISNLPLTLKERLICLFNAVFNQGIYPQSWRTAVIVPIPKPNKPKTDVGGYRPISLISCMSKTLEKIIAKRLMWFLISKNVISHNQTAFKRKQSTIDTLLHLQYYVSNALSSKNHISILATDFEKAFDRIGIHIVLQQISSWQIGPKIYNIIKAFLTHRHFRIKINSVFSKTYSLQNGIPQGSPLSVVLFIIAFEQLSQILNMHSKIEHCIYADDAIIFTKTSDMNTVQTTFTNILNDIKEWGKTSGANLSIDKCKILHICRKKNCTSFNLSYENIAIECVNHLKILGIVFEKNFTFKQQCLKLRYDLAARLNIIKYLSSKHCHIHVNILTQITRALVLSKIEYALPIFGWCATSHLKLLNKPYHTAVRRSLNAFPTSATTNILTEAGLPAIRDHVEATTFKLIPKLFNSSNAILHKDVKSTIKSTKKMKTISTIRRCINFSKLLPAVLKPQFIKSSIEPPWHLKESAFLKELQKYPKETTPSFKYQQLFFEIENKFKDDGWIFIYTDGSKNNTGTSFAVVLGNNHTIKLGILDRNCSIFSAEAVAIKNATDYAKTNRGKFVICTDSRSTLAALENIKNQSYIICQIRDACIKYHNKIKLMWVPGHTGIPGNDLADQIANSAHTTPCFKQHYISEKDTSKLVKIEITKQKEMNWSNYVHRYSSINSDGVKAVFPASTNHAKTKLMIRLRVGHSQITNEHLLIGKPNPECPFCSNTILTIDHLIDECSNLHTTRLSIFGSIRPSTLLNNFTNTNIDKFFNFFKIINLLNKI